MFKRPLHQKILEALQAFDAELLSRAECYFAGGTAIVLSLDEYRESVGIEFLCASKEGYRLLRNCVGSNDLGLLVKTSLPVVREVRSDRNKTYTVVAVGDTKIKIEFVSEGRVALSGGWHPTLPVPVLCRDDLYTQKLLANDDRGLDRSTLSRDIIDLAMMIQGWGEISRASWDKAYAAYGDRLSRMFHHAVGMIDKREYLLSCLDHMAMDKLLAPVIVKTLHTAASKLPLNEIDNSEFDRRISLVGSRAHVGGPAGVLDGHLLKAIKGASSFDLIDWSTVEIEAACESIFDFSHSVESSIEAIVQNSPGTVSKDRQHVVANRIEANLEQFRADWLEESNCPGDTFTPDRF